MKRNFLLMALCVMLFGNLSKAQTTLQYGTQNTYNTAENLRLCSYDPVTDYVNIFDSLPIWQPTYLAKMRTIDPLTGDYYFLGEDSGLCYVYQYNLLKKKLVAKVNVPKIIRNGKGYPLSPEFDTRTGKIFCQNFNDATKVMEFGTFDMKTGGFNKILNIYTNSIYYCQGLEDHAFAPQLGLYYIWTAIGTNKILYSINIKTNVVTKVITSPSYYNRELACDSNTGDLYGSLEAGKPPYFSRLNVSTLKIDTFFLLKIHAFNGFGNTYDPGTKKYYYLATDTLSLPATLKWEYSISPNGKSVSLRKLKNNIYAAITYTPVILPTCSDTLSGTITQSNHKPLSRSWIYMVHYNAKDTTVKAIDSMLTDTLGHYSFVTCDTLVYLYVAPDSVHYPKELPTYYDSTTLFMYAAFIKLKPGNKVVNFSTLHGNNHTGSGFIGGKVALCTLCKKGDPVSGLKIILADSLGKVIACTWTDANGDFSFKNISLEKYKIWVDNPKIDNSMAPVVTLNSVKPSASNLIFTLYPDKLDMTIQTGIQNLSNNFKPSVQLSPNPVLETGTVTYTLTEPQNIQIEILDITGKRIRLLSNSIQPTGQNKTDFDATSLPSGFYLIRFTTGTCVENLRMLKAQK